MGSDASVFLKIQERRDEAAFARMSQGSLPASQSTVLEDPSYA
jgi:hypothetical protein